MIEIKEAIVRRQADGSFTAEIKIRRRPKGIPRPLHRGVRVHDKTPVALRGRMVNCVRLGRAGPKGATWTINDIKTRKTLCYANEIYLTNATPRRLSGRDVISGIIIAPSDEGRSLAHPVATDPTRPGVYFLAESCPGCRKDHIIEAPVALARLTPRGVFV